MATAAEKRKRREERVKLFATAVSNVGVATIVTGFVVPLLAGRAQPLSGAGAFLLGVALHLLAQGMLHLVVLEETEETG